MNSAPRDSSVVIDIYKYLGTNEHETSQNSHGVCVCRVPKSLVFGKPEAFSPQFVGLGPYHHFRAGLTMIDDLKLGAAKRVLKDLFPNNKDGFLQLLKDYVSDMRALYHADVNSSHNDDETFRYLLVIDGLFLLALVCCGDPTNNYFLTGKHGLPLVNSVGVELTLDAIIPDVFMLENQIPTPILKQISQVVVRTEIQVENDLGSNMKNFCEKYCPVVKLENLTRGREEYDHLLDLMYHLIILQPPRPKSKPLGSDQRPESKTESENKDEEGKDSGKSRADRNTCSCMKIFVYLLCAFFVLAIIVFVIWFLLSLVLSWLYNLLAWLSKKVHPTVNKLHAYLSKSDSIPFLGLIKPLVGVIKDICEDFAKDAKGDKDGRPPRMIPSVMELDGAGIHFEAAVAGGISYSSIDFHEDKCKFLLPTIKLDVNSEVIIRNLVAYESLKFDSLIFTRYIEIMQAVIDTPQDVKLLVDNKIIHTDLSHVIVKDLFKGMSKSIKPTKTPELEEVIEKVNHKYLSKKNKGMFSCGKLLVLVTTLVILVITVRQTYCSFFNCSGTSVSVELPEGGDNNRNNYFISSM